MSIGTNSDFSKMTNTAATAQPAAAVQANTAQTQQPQTQQSNFVNPGVNVNQQPQGYSAMVNNNFVPDGIVGTGLLSQGLEFDVPYNQTSGKVQAFLTELEKAAKNYTNLQMSRDHWDFLVFDGVSNQSPISAILFVRRAKTVAVTFAYLIQETSETFADRQITVNRGGYQNVTYNIPRLPEELLTSDPELAPRIEAYVAATYAGKGIDRAILAGGLVLPPELEPQNIDQLNRVLFYANSALESTLFKVADNPRRFTIARKASNEVLDVKMDFDAGQGATSVGAPVRSDVSIKLHITDNRNQNNQSIMGKVNRAFSTVRGYMALQYVGLNHMMMQQQQAMSPWGMPRYPGVFQPSFVISSLDNQFSAATLETQLLAIATSAVITRDNAWINCFKPDTSIRGEAGSDPRDIGMLTIDVAYPGEEKGYSDIKGGQIDFYEYVAKWIIPNVLFQIDVPELGDLTYIQRVFLEASGATGNDATQQAANAAIIEAANYLTNGRFAAHWAGNEPIVVNQVGKVVVGHYFTDKNERRDLADIDYLYLLNRFYTTPELAQRFADTMTPGNGELERLAERVRIYQENFSGCQIRGFAKRLTFNSKFIIALSKALEEVGGTFNTSSYFYSGQTQERGYQNNILGIGANMITNFTQGNGFNQGVAGGYYNHYQTIGMPVYGYR